MFDLHSTHHHIHHHYDEHTKEVLAGLVALHKALDLANERLKTMSAELDALAAQVKSNSDLLDSATILINGIADRITAAGVDPAKLAALTNELKAKDDALAAAVTANTPAA